MRSGGSRRHRWHLQPVDAACQITSHPGIVPGLMRPRPQQRQPPLQPSPGCLCSGEGDPPDGLLTRRNCALRVAELAERVAPVLRRVAPTKACPRRVARPLATRSDAEPAILQPVPGDATRQRRRAPQPQRAHRVGQKKGRHRLAPPPFVVVRHGLKLPPSASRVARLGLTV